jgi:hypothetical protein
MNNLYSSYRINIQYKAKERQLLNAVIAVLTAVLTLIYPEFLYLIAGGYLIVLGLLLIYFRLPAIIPALPLVAGILIFIFPELIPYTFAGFLGFFGVILLLAFQFAILGFLTLIIAVLIVMNPDAVAYFIAIFLLLYGISNLIRHFAGNGNRENLVQ